MSSVIPPVVERMQSLAGQWTESSDQRSIFLNCYAMMTSSMLSAIEAGEFRDPAWVYALLHRFADYYFVALEAYEASPGSAPRAWQQAHAAALDPDASPLQKLLAGVNAHINYDLVLTLVDVLEPEWPMLSEGQRAQRYADHCQVNEVLARTIDAVQDAILEPVMPGMDLVDRMLGPLDEMLISQLMAHWRDGVWQHVILLMSSEEALVRAQVLEELEEAAVRRGDSIMLRSWRGALGGLLA